MSSEKITLVYFNTMGRAEVSRLLLAYGGVDYEDKRLTKEEWAEYKPNTPTGQIPMLIVDGKKLCQSNAIERFLAKKVGLMGSDDFETARADMVMGTVGDFVNKFVTMMFEEDEKRKASLKEAIDKEHIPQLFKVLEAITKESGGDWVAGRKMTYADVALTQFFSGASKVLPPDFDLSAVAPTVTAITKKVADIPNIKKWMETRPKTER